MKDHIKLLEKLSACNEAVTYADQFNTLNEAWQVCGRGDWMLWLAGQLSGKPESESRKRLILVVCQCARLSLEYTTDPQPLKTIEIVEAWAKGDPTITFNDVRNASYASNAAANAA